MHLNNLLRKDLQKYVEQKPLAVSERPLDRTSVEINKGTVVSPGFFPSVVSLQRTTHSTLSYKDTAYALLVDIHHGKFFLIQTVATVPLPQPTPLLRHSAHLLDEMLCPHTLLLHRNLLPRFSP